jgi:hypothetical protein
MESAIVKPAFYMLIQNLAIPQPFILYTFQTYIDYTGSGYFSSLQFFLIQQQKRRFSAPADTGYHLD